MVRLAPIKQFVGYFDFFLSFFSFFLKIFRVATGNYSLGHELQCRYRDKVNRTKSIHAFRIGCNANIKIAIQYISILPEVWISFFSHILWVYWTELSKELIKKFNCIYQSFCCMLIRVQVLKFFFLGNKVVCYNRCIFSKDAHHFFLYVKFFIYAYQHSSDCILNSIFQNYVKTH